jgi:hypothetical protein
MPLAEDRLVGLHFKQEQACGFPGTVMKHKATRIRKSIRTRRTAKHAAAHARRVPMKTPQGDFIDSLIAATAQVLDLTIDPAWRDSVKFNLRLVFEHAARVEGFSLSDDAEPAPVFHA